MHQLTDLEVKQRLRISTLERARRYVAKCPPAVSGQAGHNAACHAAVVLIHGFDLSETDAVGIAHDVGAVPDLLTFVAHRWAGRVETQRLDKWAS